ncbi:TetR/AcrR family transcriptional regulator [Lactobacillus sp. LC28-10]|uniref:TetR/AcrR family transcriptional regulator n=1 Tax=Secundilactobacillus angelensis TaxID=2722706 RepID=A0ABX1KWB8_9LACO|nr:TetR/AcrR family transcriptional regulator [Secundilactobacillus angelensis]MCH5461604.1 TetR/AcrR family transcriptional regulator [Secundilactobacillus angelensis]NLR17899.1 TetR/AcrR family transcriptional regulator [Secundilactobacillus angelensis]
MVSYARLRTRNQITSAMLTLLKTHRIENIEVTQICEAAFIKRSTFYRYFHDKIELTQAVLDKLLEDWQSAGGKVPTAAKIADFFMDNYDVLSHLRVNPCNRHYAEIQKLLQTWLMNHITAEDQSATPIIYKIRKAHDPMLLSAFLLDGTFGVLAQADLSNQRDRLRVRAFLIGIVERVTRAK